MPNQIMSLVGGTALHIAKGSPVKARRLVVYLSYGVDIYPQCHLGIKKYLVINLALCCIYSDHMRLSKGDVK